MWTIYSAHPEIQDGPSFLWVEDAFIAFDDM